jgi:hypothetical protein
LETRRRFEIEVTREAEAHLEWLSARDRATVFDALDRRLAYEPTIENRNRKRLRPNPLAPWEMRIGHLRNPLILNAGSGIVIGDSDDRDHPVGAKRR